MPWARSWTGGKEASAMGPLTVKFRPRRTEERTGRPSGTAAITAPGNRRRRSRPERSPSPDRDTWTTCRCSRARLRQGLDCGTSGRKGALEKDVPERDAPEKDTPGDPDGTARLRRLLREGRPACRRAGSGPGRAPSRNAGRPREALARPSTASPEPRRGPRRRRHARPLRGRSVPCAERSRGRLPAARPGRAHRSKDKHRTPSIGTPRRHFPTRGEGFLFQSRRNLPSQTDVPGRARRPIDRPSYSRDDDEKDGIFLLDDASFSGRHAFSEDGILLVVHPSLRGGASTAPGKFPRSELTTSGRQKRTSRPRKGHVSPHAACATSLSPAAGRLATSRSLAPEHPFAEEKYHVLQELAFKQKDMGKRPRRLCTSFFLVETSSPGRKPSCSGHECYRTGSFFRREGDAFVPPEDTPPASFHLELVGDVSLGLTGGLRCHSDSSYGMQHERPTRCDARWRPTAQSTDHLDQ